MAGSTTKTVFEIFQTMDYGPSSSSLSTAQVKFMTDVKQALAVADNGTIAYI